MKSVFDFVKTTLIGGLLVILPATLIIVFIKHGAEAVRPLLMPVITRLPANMPFPNAVALVIESLVVILSCFVIGLVFRTTLGKRVTVFVESRILNRFPGYLLLRTITRGAMGEEETIHFKVALTEMEGGLVPSFITAEHTNGHYTVFVPSAPTPMSGAIYIFPCDKVHIVDVPFSQAVRCITKLGIDSGKLLEGMRSP